MTLLSLTLLTACGGADSGTTSEGEAPVRQGPLTVAAELLCLQHDASQEIQEFAADGISAEAAARASQLSADLRETAVAAGYADANAVYTALRSEGLPREQILEAVEAECDIDTENQAFQSILTDALGQ